MTIYVLGPSGVGKTHCAGYAATILRAEHRDLDALCKWRESDWACCQRAFDGIESEAKLRQVFISIDIGAGTQRNRSLELQQYLMPRRQHVVLVWAPPSEVIRRKCQWPGRLPEEFEQTEYKTRDPLYSIATHKVDVSCKSRDEAKAQFARYIHEAFGVPARQFPTGQ